jgi:hypothetical protein
VLAGPARSGDVLPVRKHPSALTANARRANAAPERA